jgi:hypothetical protein
LIKSKNSKNVRIQRKISNYERIKEHLKFFFCIHILRNVEDAKDYHVAQVTTQVTSTYVETPTSKQECMTNDNTYHVHRCIQIHL